MQERFRCEFSGLRNHYIFFIVTTADVKRILKPARIAKYIEEQHSELRSAVA